VLLNLLTNGIKYNKEQGEIFVTVTVPEPGETKGEGENLAQIEVRDTGRGISKEGQEHMFDKFYGVPDTAGDRSGTGLGVVIAIRIVEAHGGGMWLQSEQGVGTSFFFTLPKAEPPKKVDVDKDVSKDVNKADIGKADDAKPGDQPAASN